MAAIQSCQFSSDGAFLTLCEAADFVHVFDVHRLGLGYERAGGVDCQTIDFFGEIAGAAFTPRDGEQLFVGVSDERYG